MTQPCMRAYTQLVIKTCHKRGVHAMGGMAARSRCRRGRPSLHAACLPAPSPLPPVENVKKIGNMVRSREYGKPVRCKAWEVEGQAMMQCNIHSAALLQTTCAQLMSTSMPHSGDP